MTAAIWYLLAVISAALVVLLWPSKSGGFVDSFHVITTMIRQHRKSGK